MSKPISTALGAALALLLLAGCGTAPGATGDGAPFEGALAADLSTAGRAEVRSADALARAEEPQVQFRRAPAATTTTEAVATTEAAVPPPVTEPATTAPPPTEPPTTAPPEPEPTAPPPTEPPPPPPTAPPAPPFVPSSSALSGPAADFLTSLNGLRASAGQGALAVDDRLVLSAAAQIDVMIGAGGLSHQDLSDELALGWSIVGENVGFGPNEPVIHAALVASPPHHANLVQPRYTHVGIAVTVDGTGRMWVAQVFGG